MANRRPTSTTTPGVFAALVLVASCGTSVRPVEYRLPQVSVVSVAGLPTRDGRATFASVFCSVLPHTPDPDNRPWGPCQTYLDVPASVPAPPAMPFSTTRPIVFVGGVFSQCLEHAPKPLTTFQDARERLTSLGFATHYIPVSPNGGSAGNARQIDKWFDDHPDVRDVIAFGHSKGGVDLLEAALGQGTSASRIAALVTIASPQAGSRLPDQMPKWLNELPDRLTTPSRCQSTLPWGSGALESLRRKTRMDYLDKHRTLPGRLRTYSVAAVVDEAHVSKIFDGLWKTVKMFSLDQDSQVIADDAVAPGAMFLGRARGDHWAVAFPVELLKDSFWDRNANWNRYPRKALIEAAVRVVVADLAQ